MPDDLAVLGGFHFNPSATCRVARWEFVPGFVGQLHLARGAPRIDPIAHGDIQVHRLVAQHVARALERRVKQFRRRFQTERFGVVAHDFEHLGVAPHKRVQAVGRARFEEDIAGTDDDRVVDARHVARVARCRFLAVRCIGGIQPLVVGRLFHVIDAGVVAFEISGVRNQGVATCTDFAVRHVFTVERLVKRVLHHRQLVQRRLVLAQTVWTVSFVGVDEHVRVELQAIVKFEVAAVGIAGCRGLLVARHTTHAIERQAVLKQCGHGVMRLSVVVSGKMPHRRMARGAFVLQLELVVGVHQNLVAHLRSPERVAGTVGHEGAAPVVRDVHVPAVGHGLCGEGLTGDAGKAVGVFAVAAGAFATSCKQGVGRIRQTTVRRSELRGMVWAAVLMPMLRSIDGTYQPQRHQRRTQSYPSNRLHLVQV